MTRRQSNNHWSGGIAAQPAPNQKIPSAKSAGKVLASIFWDQDGILPIDYIPKDQTVNAEYYSSLLAGAIEGHFEGKTPRKGHQGNLVLARHCPDSPGTCNPLETGLPGFPMPWSHTQFSGCGPVGLPPVPCIEKQLKGRPFSSDTEVIAAAETRLDGQLSDFFLSGLQKLEQRDKKCIEHRGKYVE